MTHTSVRVLFFASARERVGARYSEIGFPPDNNGWLPSQILAHIVKQKPVLEDIRSTLLVAVNMDYKTDEGGPIQLREGDEVALIPPVSGG